MFKIIDRGSLTITEDNLRESVLLAVKEYSAKQVESLTSDEHMIRTVYKECVLLIPRQLVFTAQKLLETNIFSDMTLKVDHFIRDWTWAIHFGGTIVCGNAAPSDTS